MVPGRFSVGRLLECRVNKSGEVSLIASQHVTCFRLFHLNILGHLSNLLYRQIVIFIAVFGSDIAIGNVYNNIFSIDIFYKISNIVILNI